MDYIYDIVLNFQDNYYDFYEWKKEDKIINVKKIPIYKIPTKEYIEIKNYKVSIDQGSLPQKNKMFLITNGIEVMGIILDNNGKVIKKSSLLFDESDEIIEDKDVIKLINIKYKIIGNKILNYESRVTREKNKHIKSYFQKIDKEKDKYILKYLYYDIYHINENNLDKIYQDLKKLTKKDINKMYESIKRVNQELKNKITF